ncbi:MAG: hypothetical protein Q8Q08_13000 [Candidatus Omnitrophota bacterium]|nr:hypothetical protein [Candidatus Omnitrophota bacterium]
MTHEERLRLVNDLLNGDTAFDADCVELDLIHGKPVTKREKAFADLIMRLYKLVHPAFSSCGHPNWEADNANLKINRYE